VSGYLPVVIYLALIIAFPLQHHERNIILLLPARPGEARQFV